MPGCALPPLFTTLPVRGYVPSTDPFLSDKTLVEQSTMECNLQPACTATIVAPNAPMCSLYPGDMAYARDTVGLVIDRYAYCQISFRESYDQQSVAVSL